MADLDALRDTADPENIRLKDVQAPFLDHLLEGKTGVKVFSTGERNPVNGFADLNVPVDILGNEKFLNPF